MIGRAALGHAADRPAWLWWGHAATGGAAAVLIGVGLLCGARQRGSESNGRVRGATLAFLGVVGGAVGLSLAAGLRPTPHPAAYDPEAYYRALTATNARQAANPLFPSALRVTGTVNRVTDAECRVCHAREHREWQESAHARAGNGEGYRRSLAGLVERRAPEDARWCQGCHAPERLLESVAQPGDPPVSRDAPRARGSHGVTCVSCHDVGAVPLLTGNGGLLRNAPASSRSSRAASRLGRSVARFLTLLRPAPHRAAMSAATGDVPPAGIPGDNASRLCSGCHRVGLTVAQNGYRFMRGPDEFGTWQESAISGQSIHGFQAPGPARSCLSCHAPHGSAPRVPDAVAGPPITLDLFGRRAEGSGLTSREPWAAPLERASPFLRPGIATVVDVVVVNRGLGHAFPGGFTDIRDIWLQLTVTDGRGKTILAHGLRDARGKLAPDTHGFGLLPLDREGNPLRHNELERWVASAREAAGIAPGESHVARYRLDAPAAAHGPLTIQARLNERRYTLEFAAYAGHPPPSATEVRVLAEKSVTLGGPKAGVRSPAAPTDADRWYHYGVGLLLQDDLPRATRAMREAQQLPGAGADPWLGLGRVYLREGDLLAARSQIEAAARRAPADPRPRAFLGTLYRRMGEYEQALTLLRPLARAYPADRATLFDIGLSYLRTGRPAEAAAAFTGMLELDPDDVAAHYNLWMCYQRLQRYADARLEEAIYRYLRPNDGASPALVRYLRTHPVAAVEARPIHEHRLRSVAEEEREDGH